ncbi:flagellar motor switch phosphatase FliY [Lederbergia wuyishanensis]|uniref:Flagellar motor switch protein FliN/FliY n=1 Tax=Lederbergia wuyishanensis TaxID=1347903 RepID=A0ABU0CZS5_9BACI|nr:flagellar motor switch phosphatase FliY [Lederbergia wuyishanensis]MCJ8006274.1 flagellar motor switch phosphatase FliY [Lederbergia wuyishanensis]MDQ0341643.1 flagellar motor switch protein FliN/FliY [Lederbergia wuyishanensis]
MNGEMLSQDEIDALLRGEPVNEDVVKEEVLEVSDYLTEMQQDAIGELGNISFGSSATALSTLLNQKVEITTPSVSIIDNAKLEEEFPHPYVAIQVKYTAGFSGVNILVIKQSDAAIIADLMLGGDGTSPANMLDEIHLSAVQEAMNQMMGSAATSMSSIFEKKVDISPPSIELLNFSQGEGTQTIPQQNLLVKVSFHLSIGNLIDSDIMQVLPIEFAKKLVVDLFEKNSNTQSETNPPIISNDDKLQVSKNEQSSQQSQNTINNNQPKNEHNQESNREAPKSQLNVQSATFLDFNQSNTPAPETKNLDMLLDIPLQVTVELGKTKKSVKEILELGAGSIIELDKLAGEPVEILVNSRLIAKGEVVVIDENFGVRVTDIVSQSDRLKKLN